MTQEYLLPKFGATGKQAEVKTPGSEIPLPTASHAPENTIKTAPLARKVPGPLAALAAGEPEIEDLPADAPLDFERLPPLHGSVAVPAPACGKEVLPLGCSKEPGQLDTRKAAKTIFQRWAKMKNPFNARLVARNETTPAQGELRLESVKVIRNDLSEADLEVVAARPEKAAGAVARANSGPDRTKVVWQRIATRLFGTGRT